MSDDELIEMATLAGLDALDDAELAEVEAALREAAPEVQSAYAAALRATREAMARVSAVTATPPPVHLRDAVLSAATGGPADADSADVVDAAEGRGTGIVGETAGDAASSSEPVATLWGRRRRALTYLAAAAAIAVIAGVVGWLFGTGGESPPRQPPVAEQVFSAKDVASRSGAVATGRATVTYSDSADAAVLVMNDVPPPQPGSVYQMWLEGADGSMTPAGTMGPEDVAPSTTAVITGVRDASGLAFTVEPPGGSPQPTGDVVARVPFD